MEEVKETFSTGNNQPKKEQKPQKKKTLFKYILNISIVLVITGFAVFISVKDDFGDIINYLNKAFTNTKWLLILIAILLSITFLKTCIYFFFARMYTKKYHIWQGLAIDQIGIFYNAVTPGATGGQPMQAYTYKKQGIAISSAVSMLAMFSILYQLFLIIFGVLAFIIKFDLIMSIGSIDIKLGSIGFSISIIPLTIIGFLLNAGYIGIVLLMSYWKGFHRFMMGPIINLLHKMHILKDVDKSRESLRTAVENFKIEMRRLFSNIPFLILISIFFILFMSLNFSIPYFVGMVLNNESLIGQGWSGFFNSIWLSNYHQMITGIIPIPGAAGVSEIFFNQLFLSADASGNYSASSSFFYSTAGDSQTAALGSAALLLWRSLTFTLPLIVAGFVTAFYRASPKDDAVKEGKFANHSTMVELQKMTYAEREKQMVTLVETSRLTREAIMKKLKSFSSQNNRKKKSKKNDIDSFDIGSKDEDS